MKYTQVLVMVSLGLFPMPDVKQDIKTGKEGHKVKISLQTTDASTHFKEVKLGLVYIWSLAAGF